MTRSTTVLNDERRLVDRKLVRSPRSKARLGMGDRIGVYHGFGF